MDIKRPEITRETLIAPSETNVDTSRTDSTENIKSASSTEGITQFKDSIEVQSTLQSELQFPTDALETQRLQDALQILANKGNELAFEKFEEVLPKLMDMVGCDATGDNSQMKEQFTQLLEHELQSAGIDVSPDEVQNLVDAMGKGGAAGMAVALYICSAIAENPNLDLHQMSQLAAAYSDSPDGSSSTVWGQDPINDSSAAQALITMASNCYPDSRVIFTPDQLQTMALILPSGHQNVSDFIKLLISTAEAQS